jgi:glycosyltransferase involved in cell wall biosynthesis
MANKGLFMSDSPKSPTGFSGQTKYVFDHVSNNMKHETDWLGWQTVEKGEMFESGDKPREALPVLHEKDMFGKEALEQYINEGNYDYLWTLGDAWLVNHVPQKKFRPFWMMYYPVDGAPLNQDISSTLQQADMRIAMSKFGKTVVEEHGIQTEYIQHQVNRKVFSNVSKNNKADIRSKYFPQLKKDDILIGSFARMNPRKHHMRLFKAFEEVLENTDKKVYLYLHGDLKDIMYNTYINMHDYLLVELVDTLGIKDNVITPPAPYSHKTGVSKADYVNLMRSMDFHVLSTGGEGFGVPTVEAMSLGIPTIATDYTTSAEFISHENVETNEVIKDESKHRGKLVPYDRLYMETSGVNKAWVDTSAMADAMLDYINNPDLVKQHGKNALKYAKYYDSEYVNKKWTNIFKKIPKVKIHE